MIRDRTLQLRVKVTKLKEEEESMSECASAKYVEVLSVSRRSKPLPYWCFSTDPLIDTLASIEYFWDA